MKKIIAYIVLVLICSLAHAQGNIQTKQFILSDFGGKTMKVVLSSSEMLNTELRVSMQDIWHIGPYEFCDNEEFEQLKNSSDYYFLLMTEQSGNQKTAGIKFLSIFKGRESDKNGLDGLYKVISIPFSTLESPDDRQIIFLPAILSALQDNIFRISKRTLNIGSMAVPVKRYSMSNVDKKILVDENDLDFEPDPQTEEYCNSCGVQITDSEHTLQSIIDREEDKIVCHLVSAAPDSRGSACYIMLFDSSTFELLLLKNHVRKSETENGISREMLQDIISFSKNRK